MDRGAASSRPSTAPMLEQGEKTDPPHSPDAENVTRQTLCRALWGEARNRWNRVLSRGWYGEAMTLTGLAIFLILGVAAFVLVNKLKDH